MVKTELRFSWIYNVVLNELNFDYTLPQYKKFIKNCKPFKKLYKKNIDKIIKLIEKHTKRKKWSYNFIPIYIVEIKPRLYKKRYSFSSPLTLKFRKNPERMLQVLIHELVHNNLSFEKQIRLGHKKREELVNSITNKVWIDLKKEIK